MAGREAMAPSLREARELIVAGHYREARAVLHRLSLVSLRLQDESAVAKLERVIPTVLVIDLFCPDAGGDGADLVR